MSHLRVTCHQVLCDGYVTASSGTGVVHQAPAFGEDDYRVALANGVLLAVCWSLRAAWKVHCPCRPESPSHVLHVTRGFSTGQVSRSILTAPRSCLVMMVDSQCR